MKIYNPTGFSTNLTGSFSGSVKGTLTATGNIIPAIDQAFDLGSSDKRFRDIYLSSASIYLGNTVITEDNVVTTASLASTLPAGVISSSNQLAGETIDGDLTITGTVTAQEFHTEFVSASIIYQSGSTQFGNSADDTHTFSGNVEIYKGDGYDTGTGFFNLTHAEATRYKGFIRLKTPAGAPIFSIGTIHDSTVYDTLFLRSGNVGIGTDTPNFNLEVRDTDDVTLNIVKTGANTLRISTTSTEGIINVVDNKPLSLRTNNTEALHISGDGNVGIGPDAPSRKFHISGGTNNVTCRVDTTEADPNFTLTTLNQQDWSIGIDYSDGGKLKFDSSTSVGADTKFTFTGGGNLGIGVTSPDEKLTVNGHISVPFSFNLAVSGGGYSRNNILSTGYNNGGDLKDFLILQAPGSSNAKIVLGDANHRVGIGVSTPGAKLDVDGNIIAGGGNSIISGTGLFTTSLIQLHNGTAAANNIDRMADIVLANNTSYTDGILGRIIAVNSSLSSDEKRNAQISFNNDGATNSGVIYFATTNAGTFSTKMTIKGNGNVGINELNPKARLHVSAPYPTYTDFGTVFYGGTTNNSSQNGIMLGSAGNALSGIVGSNLLIDGTTFSQTNTGRSSGWLQITNTTVADQTSTLTYRGYVKGSTTALSRVTIDGAGNVGIGTSVPDHTLSLLGPSASTYTFSWQNSGRIKGTLYSDTGGVAIQAGTNFNDSAIYMLPNLAFDFRLNGSTRMYMNSSGNLGVGTTNPVATLDVNGTFRQRGDTYNEFTFAASGDYTSGTYYNIVNSAEGILQGMYVIHCYVDTYSAGGGIYFMHFASVPFYWVNTGTNNTNFQDLPTVLGTGHARNGVTPPSFRLQQSSGATDGKMYLQFNPNANWTSMNGTGGRTFTVWLKRLGG